MKNEIIKPEGSRKDPSRLFGIFQIVPSILLLLCVLFGIYVGMYFLRFLERTESHRSSIINKWSETGFEQLQQMNATIKQELDLIMDQRRENKILQEKVEELTAQSEKNRLEVPSLPSVQEGQQ